MPDTSLSSAVSDQTSEKSLRLLFVIDGTFPTLGGAETQARKLANALRDRGHHVTFVTPRVLVEQSLSDEVDGFEIKRIDYPHVRAVGAVIMLYRFARFVKKHGHEYDAIHVHITRLLAGTAAALKPFVKRPIITKVSGYFEFNGGVLDESRRWMPVNFIIRRALRKIDFFQTISEQTREKLIQAGYSDEQIRFVPNGIDTDIPFAEGTSTFQNPDSDTLVFGYCGRLRHVKGVHILMEAFAGLVKDNPDKSLLLRLAGDGFEMEPLREQAEAAGIEQQVELLGKVADTAEAYKSFDFYVQPSFAEGLPNAVIEAMLAQLPVVASKVGGNVDLVKENSTGQLFEPGDTAALRLCLQRCVDEPEQVKTMAKGGYDLICQKYGFDTVTENLIELYRS